MKSVTIECLSEAVSPLTHMSGSAGNESIVAREPVHTEHGVMMVPYLSGNAIRHRCIREPMALWLIERYGLRERLDLAQLNFLLHGGNLTSSNASENTRLIADMHRLWPLLKLCGGSLPNHILAGSLNVWRGTLVCEENRGVLSQVVDWLPGGRIKSFESFVDGYQYTRGDARKTGMVTEANSKGQLMIYSGQCVTPGALFFHGFVLRGCDDIELGCLLLALRLWQASGGTIGGQSRIGHGRLKLNLIEVEDDGGCVQAYIDHVDSVADEARDWLSNAFASGEGRKSRKTASEA